jgi:hypothetical protein
MIREEKKKGEPHQKDVQNARGIVIISDTRSTTPCCWTTEFRIWIPAGRGCIETFTLHMSTAYRPPPWSLYKLCITFACISNVLARLTRGEEDQYLLTPTYDIPYTTVARAISSCISIAYSRSQGIKFDSGCLRREFPLREFRTDVVKSFFFFFLEYVIGILGCVCAVQLRR